MTAAAGFGPDSMAWKVLSAPTVSLMIAQITNLLEVPHVDFQSVLLEHDPLYRRSGGTFRDRISRTVARPLPIVFGDNESARRCASRLMAYHRPMTGTNPDDGSTYSATSQESMLFAAVTISHAGLLAYERLTFDGNRFPQRRSADDRDRYFAEMAALAEHMGVPPSWVPRSAAQVAQYYRSVEHKFRYRHGWYTAQLRTAAALVVPGGGDARARLTDVALMATSALALAVLPKPSRRLHRLPPAVDPLLAALRVGALPLLRLLSEPTVGGAAQRWLLGADAEVITRARAALV